MPARKPVWHTHYLPEEHNAALCFRRRVITTACATLLVGTTLLAVPLFTPEVRALRALIALGPLALLYYAHVSLLAAFLWRTPLEDFQVIRMGCTLQIRDSHFRRSTSLSMHPLLFKWYWAAVWLYMPLNALALVLLVVFWLTGFLGPLASALAVLATALSFAYAHSLATRFCSYCVDGAIAHAIPTDRDLGRYTLRRAGDLVREERLLNKAQLEGRLAMASSSFAATDASLAAAANAGANRRGRHRRR